MREAGGLAGEGEGERGRGRGRGGGREGEGGHSLPTKLKLTAFSKLRLTAF